MNWVYIVAGGLLLIFGRKLFWLFVAIVGFFNWDDVYTEIAARPT